MVRKKVEGDEEQRRASAREARQAGQAPSAAGRTTGASKQRHHVAGSESHSEHLEGIHRGKQQLSEAPRPLQHREHVREDRGATVEPEPIDRPPVSVTAGGVELDAEQARVYQAVADLEARDEPGYLQEVATAAGLPVDQTRREISALLRADLLREVAGAQEPDLGPRYELSPT